MGLKCMLLLFVSLNHSGAFWVRHLNTLTDSFPVVFLVFHAVLDFYNAKTKQSQTASEFLGMLKQLLFFFYVGHIYSL